MRVCGRGGVGFHTLFLLALVSVFLYLAVLCMCVHVCVVRPFGALLCILNILARHTIVSPWFMGITYSEYPDRTDEDASHFVGKGNERVEEYVHTHGLRKWFHK